MASAWEQAAEIQPVNQRMRQLQLSMAVGESLHARHSRRRLDRGDDAAHRVARVQPPSRAGGANPLGRTLTAQMMAHVAAGAGDARGDAAHRPAARTADAADRRAGISRARRATPGSRGSTCNGASTPPRRGPHRSGEPPRACRVRRQRGHARIWNSGVPVVAEGQPLPPLPGVDPLPPAWDYPGHFRAAAADASVAHSPRRDRCDRPARLDERDGRHSCVRRCIRACALANLARAIDRRPATTCCADGARCDAGRHRDGDDGAVVPAADVRAAQGEVAGPAAAGLDNGQARHRGRAQDQSRVRRGLHDRSQLRDGARAAVARLSRPISRAPISEHFWGTDARQRRGRRHRRPAQEPRPRARRGAAECAARSNSCCCCEAACCAAIRTRSSI